MSAVQAHLGLDQARLGEEVGVDRATLANVVGRLERRGLERRRASAVDRRLRLMGMRATLPPSSAWVPTIGVGRGPDPSLGSAASRRRIALTGAL